MKNRQISIIGLGYVGLPIAVAFSEQNVQTIGYDKNSEKIALYKKGIDPTNEVGDERIKEVKNLLFTSNYEDLRKASFHIVAVPTPVKSDHSPDLEPLISASKTVGKILKEGDIVVYESTVYPGVTEEVCVPILEEESTLTCGRGFKVGYSPERINPGDHEHRLENIVKVVAGMDEESLDEIAETYSKVVKEGVFKASSIRIAEAAKVIENSQRDINIAFMNELSMIFDKMNINTAEVLAAARTKWNFLDFKPGLVGGHCIGVDPYYLTYKAQALGYNPEVILSGRKINDEMGKYIAEKTIYKLSENKIASDGSKVAVLGLTFKENCPDIRNSKVFDIIQELERHGVQCIVSDAQANKEEVLCQKGIDLVCIESICEVDAVVVAVAHSEYRNLDYNTLEKMFKNNDKRYILIDVKNIMDNAKDKEQFAYWSL